MSHPSERFDAPRSIEKGRPLKLLLNETLVYLIAESFSAAWEQFDHEHFISQANDDLEDLELSERGRHIGIALRSDLPHAFDEALPVLLKSLGPPLGDTEDIGLAPFFYFPHSHYIALSAVESADAGLQACYELTKRFTAEFCIRPLIVRHHDKVMATLCRWTNDTDCHVRRLVSEGTRPRLPWAPRLPRFIDEPGQVVGLGNLDAIPVDVKLVHTNLNSNHIELWNGGFIGD